MKIVLDFIKKREYNCARIYIMSVATMSRGNTLKDYSYCYCPFLRYIESKIFIGLDNTLEFFGF